MEVARRRGRMEGLRGGEREEYHVTINERAHMRHRTWHLKRGISRHTESRSCCSASSESANLVRCSLAYHLSPSKKKTDHPTSP